MILTHSENVTIERDVVDDIICNKCGQKIKKGKDIDSQYPDYIHEEVIEVKADFGYFSRIFHDGEKHKFHLCEKCYYDIVNSFIIPVEKEYNFIY